MVRAFRLRAGCRAGLVLGYALSEGAYELWAVNLANLGGQNELLTAGQAAVFIWGVFLALQAVVGLAVKPCEA